jgi:hypothetical protein
MIGTMKCRVSIFVPPFCSVGDLGLAGALLEGEPAVDVAAGLGEELGDVGELDGGVPAVGLQAPDADALDVAEDDVEAGGGLLDGLLVGGSSGSQGSSVRTLVWPSQRCWQPARGPELVPLGDGLRGDHDREAGGVGDDLPLPGCRRPGGPLADLAAVELGDLLEEGLELEVRRNRSSFGAGCAVGALLADADAAELAGALLDVEDGHGQSFRVG